VQGIAFPEDLSVYFNDCLFQTKDKEIDLESPHANKKRVAREHVKTMRRGARRGSGEQESKQSYDRKMRRMEL
jgi:hypothetical protein